MLIEHLSVPRRFAFGRRLAGIFIPTTDTGLDSRQSDTPGVALAHRDRRKRPLMLIKVRACSTPLD